MPRLDDSAESRSRRRNRCISLFPNRSNPFLPPVANPWTRKCFLVAPALIGLNFGQHGAESLVGHDVALRDSPLLFEGHEGQTAPSYRSSIRPSKYSWTRQRRPRSSSVSGPGSIR